MRGRRTTTSERLTCGGPASGLARLRLRCDAACWAHWWKTCITSGFADVGVGKRRLTDDSGRWHSGAEKVKGLRHNRFSGLVHCPLGPLVPLGVFGECRLNRSDLLFIHANRLRDCVAERQAHPLLSR